MSIEIWMIANPKISVVFFAVAVTFISSLITKKFTDQNRMKELKKLQKSCQIKLKDKQGNPTAMAEVQKEMMQCSMEMMKHSFKPMFITMIPLLIFFGWMRGIYVEIFSSWLWWYIGAGVLSSFGIRKLLKIA
jgi:uncharacterized membrane protein (DUF106 family)